MTRSWREKLFGGVPADLLDNEDRALRAPPTADHVRIRLVDSFVTSEFTIIGALCIWALMLRLPFFFPDTIDWDESTYIIMGQGLLDGFLPYDRIWEMKPPLTFVAFAAVIQLLGKTVAAVRFGGYLCVVLTSYLVYRASYLIAQDKLSACIAALVSTSMMSIFARSLMTELLCVVPLSAALLLLFSDRSELPRTFLVGILIGIAVMIRTNLAVLALAVGGFVIFRPPLAPPSRLLTRGFAYASGVLLIVVITIIPYLISGRFELWFDTVIRAGIAYSSDRRSLESLLRLIHYGFGIIGTTDRRGIQSCCLACFCGSVVLSGCCVALDVGISSHSSDVMQ